ncbi:MAG: ferritin-like domain-containing protein [Gallionella sp.]
MSETRQHTDLRNAALHWLAESDIIQKVEGVHQLAKDWSANTISLDVNAELTSLPDLPGQPDKPELVSPRLVKRRGMNTIAGRAALIHALAHIEFNAINLALDAIWRFTDMPTEYYADWLQVADEEALHFSLLAEHLQELDYAYGDFPAHNSLWEMADRTHGDILARIALVPRTMEARGLDVAPSIRNKLAQAGDIKAAGILDIILRDEIGHVAIGNRWYAYLCKQRGLEPITTYARLAEEYHAPALRGPFNMEARRAAGFDEAELVELAAQENKSDENK